MFIKFSLMIFAVFFLSFAAPAQETISMEEFNKIIKNDEKPAKKNPGTKPEPVNFSKFEQEVFDEVNEARENPLKFVDYLEGYKKLIRNGVLYRPKQTPFKMNEGTVAIDGAINELSSMTALHPLEASPMLTLVARNQLADLMEDPALGHYGKDGSNLRARLAKVGKSGKVASENINYRDRIARQAVLTMVIDDGVSSRTHRKNILNPKYNMLGVACGAGKNDLMICVLVFTDTFEKNDPAKRVLPVEIL